MDIVSLPLYTFLLIVILLFLSAAYSPAKDYWANISGSELLMPPTPAAVVTGVLVTSDPKTIEGEVLFNINENFKVSNVDYRIVTYIKYCNHPGYILFKPAVETLESYSYSETSLIHKGGVFRVSGIHPLNVVGDVPEDAVVAVVRRLDAGIRTRFPDHLEDEDSSDLERIGAFVKKVGEPAP